MAIMDNRFEDDAMKLWQLVVELSDQISSTKQIASTLHNESIKLKAQALHSETGFVFRRFNTHLSQEEYDSELERMNNDLANDNQGLQYDNKQLNALLKEYEQTLDNVMASFRKRAHDVQLQELETIQHHESNLIAAETTALSSQLASETSVSVLIAECSRLLRMVLRLMGGEDPISFSQPSTPTPPLPEPSIPTASTSFTSASSSASRIFETRCAPELADPTQADWALEREIELARLERENEELRMLLQASQSAESTAKSSNLPLSLPKVPMSHIRSVMPRRSKGRGFFPEEGHVIELHGLQYPTEEEQRETLSLPDEVL